MSSKHPERIYIEQAKVISNQAFEGDQWVMRLAAPQCAKHACAGSFVHIQCSKDSLLRRPISIMRTQPKEGWLEILYKVVGKGTRLLTEFSPSDHLSLLGPIGQPFRVRPSHHRPLLIGGGVGMPPMVFLADQLRKDPAYHPMVILGSELPFPFVLTQSALPIDGLPKSTTATMPLMEEWNIPCRLTTTQGYSGCFHGLVTDLARAWLDTLTPSELQQVELFGCGPKPMLQAVTSLAKEYELPCQISLEEHMACGVGGCAGCTVATHTPTGVAMKRVCVDGPVFDAFEIF